jgi:hypothetical protein
MFVCDMIGELVKHPMLLIKTGEFTLPPCDGFGKHYSPDAKYVAVRSRPFSFIRRGTLLTDPVATVVASFGVPLTTNAELALTVDGPFDMYSVYDAVLDAQSTLVLVHATDRIVAGYAAVPWPTGKGISEDGSGKSFVFRLQPDMRRLKPEPGEAFVFGSVDNGFGFSAPTMMIYEEGTFIGGADESREELEEQTQWLGFEIWRL